MFDLPFNTRKQQKEYRHFRKKLITEGFYMLQYSVYTRICLNQETANKFLKHISTMLPKNGSVRSLLITEKQYNKMKILLGEKGYNEDILRDNRMVIL